MYEDEILKICVWNNKHVGKTLIYHRQLFKFAFIKHKSTLNFYDNNENIKM